MPVVLGENLTLEENKLSAVYKELYTKLNKAYAWTNTQTTSSNGSAAVLINRGDILDIKNCENINKCSCGFNVAYASYHNCNNAYIIDGKLYFYNTQIGSKSDYIMTSGNGTYSGTLDYTYCLDSSGKIWFVNSSEEEQIGNDSDWTFVGPDRTYGNNGYGIRNGELYGFHYKNTPIRLFPTISNIIQCVGGYSDNYNFTGFCLTSDGYIYYCYDNTANVINSNNNWSKIFYCGCIEYCMAINNDNELYYITSSSVYKQNIFNVKKSTCFNYNNSIVLTNDSKLYKGSNLSDLYNDNYGNYTDISNNKRWRDISNCYYYLYAIDEDGKLYYIELNDSPTYTQIGSGNNYQKIEGYACETTSENVIAIAWSGDTLSTSHTILTTKTPQINDNTYSDENLTLYSTINSVKTTSIDDEYRTYTRDPSKDSHFTEIPPASIHETVSVIDILNATNPNN